MSTCVLKNNGSVDHGLVKPGPEDMLNEDNMNQELRRVEYAVRGPLVERAAEIERQMEKGVGFPFSLVLRANIGDCQAQGQPPFTYIRQMLSAVMFPPLLELDLLPEDVKALARTALHECKRGSVGAYSCSAGLDCVCDAIASFLRSRDQMESNKEDIYLGAGATDLIEGLLALVMHGASDAQPTAVLVPRPQYPVFSGCLAARGAQAAHYELNEANGWALDRAALDGAMDGALRRGSRPRALVLINPGNPTGQVMSREEIVVAIKFAYEHGLFLIADEVYQENIVDKPFHSVKKVMSSLGLPYSGMPLASLLTLSKGWAAECGLRAGAVELLRMPKEVLRAWQASRAMRHCPSVPGQLALMAMMRRPVEGSPSYPLFAKELSAVRKVLRERCSEAPRLLRAIPGYSCNDIHGAMFAFPRVQLPQRAIQEANQRRISPDYLYCMELLENTGVCVVPGSGFGQAPNTFHLRTTILHPKEDFRRLMRAFKEHHALFLMKYASFSPKDLSPLDPSPMQPSPMESNPKNTRDSREEQGVAQLQGILCSATCQ